jgi:predicted RNA binding protein with dsRBD fold (UPF0201 family)
MSGVGNIKLLVEVEVNPTEDTDKVRVAVNKVLGGVKLETVDENDGAIMAGSIEGLKALSSFQELLRKERIRNAARKVFFKGLHGDAVTFYLNKQAAYIGHISFSQPEGESPLGPIHIEIQCDQPRQLIDWLAPRTA